MHGQKLQQDIEKMRKQLGPDWLYTLSIQNKASRKNKVRHSKTLCLLTNEDNASFKSTNEDDASFKSANVDEVSYKSLEHIPATEDDLYLTNTKDEQNCECLSQPKLNGNTKPNELTDTVSNENVADEVFLNLNSEQSPKQNRPIHSQVSKESNSSVSIYSAKKKSESDHAVVDYGKFATV